MQILQFHGILDLTFTVIAAKLFYLRLLFILFI